jgi:hypothetical protein
MSDRLPQIFGAVPEVVSGILLHEAQQAWRDWDPLAWQMIKLRGLLTEPGAHDGHIHVQPAHGPVTVAAPASAARADRLTTRKRRM